MLGVWFFSAELPFPVQLSNKLRVYKVKLVHIALTTCVALSFPIWFLDKLSASKLAPNNKLYLLKQTINIFVNQYYYIIANKWLLLFEN